MREKLTDDIWSRMTAAPGNRSRLRMYALASFCLAMSSTVGFAADSQLAAKKSKDSVIAAPTAGQRLSGKMHVWINIPDDQSTRFEVKLNGKDISDAFTLKRRKSSAPNGRTRTVQSDALTAHDGMRTGRNLLTARVLMAGKAPKREQLYFEWSQQPLLGATSVSAVQYPPAVGFVVPGPTKGGPVVKIGADGIQTSNCDSALQVLVLDRSELTQKDYQCFDESASLKTYLAARSNAELVVVTTMEGRTAPAGLNTSAIGGNDYSATPATLSPSGYMIIGAGQTKAGQATENYYVETTAAAPFQYAPYLTGILLHDNNNYYAFHPSEMATFTVSPNDPSRSKSVVQINDQVYTNPHQSYGAGGFWLLTLDRFGLQPIDSNWSGGSVCVYGGKLNDGTCGQFYPTGSNDTSVAYPAMTALATALTGANQSPRNLLVLTTVGTPLVYLPNKELGQAVAQLGASEYVLQKVISESVQNTYTLISSSDDDFSQGLTGKAIFSTSVYSQQKQTGYVRGLLRRDRKSLFSPGTYAHESAEQVAQGKGRVFELEPLLWSQPVAWPLTDTPGHIAAYQQLSYQVINNVLTNPSGDHLYDVRYYYFGSQATKFGEYKLDKNEYPYPANANGFSQAEWTDALGQIGTELGYLGQVQSFLGPDWVGGIMSAGTTPMVLSMFQAAGDLAETELSASQAQVRVDTSAILNLAISGLELLGDFYDPASVLGDALTLASQTSAFGDDSQSLPGAEYAAIAEATALAGKAETFAVNVENGYNMMVQAIYCDWGKLSYIGQQVADTSSPWYQTSKTISPNLVAAFDTAAKKSTYLQALPTLIYKDAWLYQQATSPSQVGSWKLMECNNKTGKCEYKCTSYYATRSIPANVTRTYGTLNDSTTGDNTIHDLYVLSQPIKSQGSDYVSQVYPSDALMTLLTGSGPGDFNLSLDSLLSSSSLLKNQAGPVYSNVASACYNIGGTKFVP
ncbi:hypothetical protein [Paludibaculum fermentans]|uniref:Uncharacterized protein n=1 Tax=Paludibaculum fermentans TaxID=1473598 RepID=A0A7S7NQH2_PALFE|nr:hypothetical protein [Paludibaculum fermentans]QOY87916.1 hypothetical protein IRI77_35150 [Paludibaculum fermentans]